MLQHNQFSNNSIYILQDKGIFQKLIVNCYIQPRWYWLMVIAIFLFFLSFFIEILWNIAIIYFLIVTVLSITDYVLLFFTNGTIQAQRNTAPRWHLGEENKVAIFIKNDFNFPANINLIDEIPIQFQKRDFRFFEKIKARGKEEIHYALKPVNRGDYLFNRIIVYVSTFFNLFQRRINIAAETNVQVYPSALHLKKYRLMAISDNSSYAGSKRVRRLGVSMEFEQIKDYVLGDDIRNINWQATARKGALMVNHYIDEKSQSIYCIVDKGRTMKMPFDDMSLLDYAINATLNFSSVALMHQNKVGLITYGATVHNILAAESKPTQINKINETLYSQQTDYNDSSLEALMTTVLHKISQRSFLLLFTNIETLPNLELQLPYLIKLASKHLVCVVFFQNTLLQEMSNKQAKTIEEIYINTIADKFVYEKKLIVKELKRHGIISILTTPQDLTIDTVNKYLELKAGRMIG